MAKTWNGHGAMRAVAGRVTARSGHAEKHSATNMASTAPVITTIAHAIATSADRWIAGAAGLREMGPYDGHETASREPVDVWMNSSARCLLSVRRT